MAQEAILGGYLHGGAPETGKREVRADAPDASALKLGIGKTYTMTETKAGMGYRTDERTWTVKSSSDRKKVTAEQMFTAKAEVGYVDMEFSPSTGQNLPGREQWSLRGFFTQEWRSRSTKS